MRGFSGVIIHLYKDKRKKKQRAVLRLLCMDQCFFVFLSFFQLVWVGTKGVLFFSVF